MDYATAASGRCLVGLTEWLSTPNWLNVEMLATPHDSGASLASGEGEVAFSGGAPPHVGDVGCVKRAFPEEISSTTQRLTRRRVAWPPVPLTFAENQLVRFVAQRL